MMMMMMMLECTKKCYSKVKVVGLLETHSTGDIEFEIRDGIGNGFDSSVVNNDWFGWQRVVE